MALINCIECGKQISDKATACTGCGCPIIVVQTFVCQECQRNIPPDLKVCPECGFPQQTNSTNENTEFQAKHQQVPLVGKSVCSYWKYIYIVLPILVLCLIVIIVVKKNQSVILKSLRQKSGIVEIKNIVLDPANKFGNCIPSRVDYLSTRHEMGSRDPYMSSFRNIVVRKNYIGMITFAADVTDMSTQEMRNLIDTMCR